MGNMTTKLQTSCSICTQIAKAGLLAYETVDDLSICASAIATAEGLGNYEGSLRLTGAQNKFEG